MLKIRIKPTELYDESHGFIIIPETTLLLEHSLLSMSKWESEWHKPFLSAGSKTPEETLSYVKHMTVNNVDPNTYFGLDTTNLNDIVVYIENPMSATKIQLSTKTQTRDTLTTEGIYLMLIQQGIPFEVEKWHFNRVSALLNLAARLNEPEKKMSQSELAQRMHDLNEERKLKLGTTG